MTQPTFDFESYQRSMQRQQTPAWLCEAIARPYAAQRCNLTITGDRMHTSDGVQDYLLIALPSDEYPSVRLWHRRKDGESLYALDYDGLKVSGAELADIYALAQRRGADSAPMQVLAWSLHDFLHSPVSC